MALKDNKKTLLIDVFDAYYYQNDELMFYSENLTSANLSNEITQTEVKNGKGNKLFTKINTGKSAKIELSSNVFSFAQVALNSGCDIVTGKGIAYKAPEFMVLDADKKITLVEVPLIETELAFIKDGEPVIGTYDDTDNTVLFSTLQEGDKVKVMPYRYETAETATTLTIDTETFAKGGRLILQTYEKDSLQNIVADIQIIAEKVLPEGSWSLNTQSEVQAQDQTISLSILADDEGNYYKVVRTPR